MIKKTIGFFLLFVAGGLAMQQLQFNSWLGTAVAIIIAFFGCYLLTQEFEKAYDDAFDDGYDEGVFDEKNNEYHPRR